MQRKWRLAAAVAALLLTGCEIEGSVDVVSSEQVALDLTFADQSVNRLIGYHVIDEARLRALDASALGDLHRDGHLMPIFMALASLANIGALVERRNRRFPRG